MRSSWTIWVGSESNNKCPLRDTQKRPTWGEEEMATWRWRERLEWCSRKPVSTGPPGDEIGKEWCPPRAFGGSVALSTPWFWLVASRTVGEHIFVAFSRPVCGALLLQPQGAHTRGVLFFSITLLTTSCFHVVNLVIYLLHTSNSSSTSLVAVTFGSFPFPALSAVPGVVADTQQMLNWYFLNEWKEITWLPF